MPRHSGGRPRNPRHVRLLALAGVVVACAVALPLAVASAGSVGTAGGADVRTSAPRPVRDAVRPSPRDPDPVRLALPGDDKPPSAAPTGSPLSLALGLVTAVRCGPELSSPDGVEAQTCVLAQGEDTWARTYYRNATGEALHAVLSLMGPGARTVQMHCEVGAEDAPGTCETPRQQARGDVAAYTAVAEFADRAGLGSLLLRSGSNRPAGTAS